jgi:sterol desaturase/sphingolipid hydroxylase (fatty acid hydroxylase superfamily)
MWWFLLQLAGCDPAPPVDNPELTWLDFWKLIFTDEMRPLALALGGVAILSLFELFWPAEKGHSARGRLRNFAYLAFFKVLGAGGVAFWFAFGPRLEIAQYQSSGLEWFACVALNLIAIDLLYYAYHRAQHAFPALWALHELHHADTELNATTSFRTFWLESPVQFLLITLPTILLFGTRGPEHAMAIAAFSYSFLVFTHCNLRLPLGPFSLWLCGPQVHRVHHSRLSEHRDRNFAQFFPVIDWILGTYHAPRRSEFPPTGTETLATDAPIVRTALWRPFEIWGELLKKRSKDHG